MFSETRYALNGDLRVAYRASREGPRDIVVVANWFTCCEHLPELPSLQGWVEAMTSLGRLVFFDQPGINPEMPWNEEIRATWARMARLAASPGTVALMMSLVAEMDVRAALPTVRVPTLVLQRTDDQFILPASGKYVADQISGA